MPMAEKRNSTKEEPKRCSINIWKGREQGWKWRREVLLIGAFLTSINLNNLSLRFIVRNI
jgi:hypothetical protein